MKKIPVLILIFIIGASATMAQDKFFTKTGKIAFYSKAPLEDIEAANNSVTAVLDSKTGNLQFAVLMKGFEFAKALMQEHFNENYIESDKFPKSEFRGQVVNNSAVNYGKDGEYIVKVKGILSIHGESKEVESNGRIVVKGGRLLASSTFDINVSDFKISIPKLVKDKVSNNVLVNVNCILEPLKN
jgi:hypothetical protein